MDAYPGLTVVVPGPRWECAVICPQEGQTIEALGGERVYGYVTVGGATAEAWQLGPGDRATLVAGHLEHGLSEWRIERAAR